MKCVPPDRRRHSACAAASARDWIDHFTWRAATRPALPWADGPQLTATELQAVRHSIAVFQRGESGEGRHLLQAARHYAARTGDHDYVRALELFVAEEQLHAALLARFLAGAALPTLPSDWTDVVFRWLRHRAGLELSVSVLVTAEVIAMVYYAALRRATRSPLLRRLCAQILEDEVGHLRFQGRQIGLLQVGRAPWRRALAAGAHRALLEITWGVVWWTHRPVFRAAGWECARGRKLLLRHFARLRETIAAASAWNAPLETERQVRRAG